MPRTSNAVNVRIIGKETSWREQILLLIGPGVLAGVSCRDWFGVLRHNLFSIRPSRLPRVISISCMSLLNSLFGGYEQFRFEAKLEDIEVKSPVFVLGHMRSGTTHLHYLLAADDRFAFPNLYQANFPHSFLVTEAVSARIQAFLLPRTRPYDNVELRMSVPYEDEFAICASCLLSPYMAAVFPKQADYFDRFLTLRDASDSECSRWRLALMTFLKKLTLKHAKRLVLKSPLHTGRIRLLLEMFPDAKFVHIHRNPYEVYQSVLHMYERGIRFGLLQDGDLVDWTERAIRQYQELYDSFFDERSLIPEGQFCELSFQELKERPIEAVKRVYQSLTLPDFDQAEPRMREYLSSVSGYRQNEFSELPASQRDHLAQRWARCFQEWGYDV